MSPTADGFARLRIAPQLGCVDGIVATLATVRGPIEARLRASDGGWTLDAALPPTMKFELVPLAAWRLVAGPEHGAGGSHTWRFAADA